jgi:hypothetical protein
VGQVFDFNAALENAASMNYMGRQGHLVTITSAEENTFAINLAAGSTFWIAGSDVQEEGVWRWIAGPESGQIISPTFWGFNHPSRGRVSNSLAWATTWIDYPDAKSTHMIVEYECPINPSATGYCSRTPSIFT